MNVLFIHQNFPGQFIHLSAELARDKKNRVVALGMNERPVPQNVELRQYSLLRASNPDTHPLLLEQEAHILRAEACAAAAFQLKRSGFVPDIIVAHPGWGEALLIKDVFPAAKLVIYCEYYYALEGQDVGFDPEIPPLNFQQQAKLRLKNTTNLLSLQIADAAISPTEWQRSTYPKWAQPKITVIHDGIDATRFRYNPKASIKIQKSECISEFTPGQEVLTYVARNLEPVRGFHIFMRALPELLARRPKAQVIVVGGDDISYGHRAPSGLDWKSHMLSEVGRELDLSRVHFCGKISYSSYVDLLQVSRTHFYWTAPFVLSWSFLEAAINDLPIVASATAPVLEFADLPTIDMISPFNQNAFVDALERHLSEPSIRSTVSYQDERLCLETCLKRQRDLINRL